MTGRDERRWEDDRGARTACRVRGEMTSDELETEVSEVGCEVEEKALSLVLCVLLRAGDFRGRGGSGGADAAIARWMSGLRSTESSDCS